MNMPHTPVADESGIQRAYQGADVASQYVAQRFESELMRLLHDTQVRVVSDVINTQSPTSVLEIAPGPGRITRDLPILPNRVCLEFNHGMIQQGARTCDPGIRWIRGNAFDLPFDVRSFDLAYTFRFIRHFHHDDRHRLYRQIRRVLVPGGHLIFDAVNAVVSRPLRDARPADYPIYDKLYDSIDGLKAELRDAGFHLINAVGVQRWFPLQYKAQILIGPRSRAVCRMLIRALERLRRGPSLEWVVLAEKI